MRVPSPGVTTVSSGAANMGLKKINFGDLQWERSYDPGPRIASRSWRI
jgi:hypothetical protein